MLLKLMVGKAEDPQPSTPAEGLTTTQRVPIEAMLHPLGSVLMDDEASLALYVTYFKDLTEPATLLLVEELITPVQDSGRDLLATAVSTESKERTTDAARSAPVSRNPRRGFGPRFSETLMRRFFADTRSGLRSGSSTSTA
jgi:hypothetical protein